MRRNLRYFLRIDGSFEAHHVATGDFIGLDLRVIWQFHRGIFVFGVHIRLLLGFLLVSMFFLFLIFGFLLLLLLFLRLLLSARCRTTFTIVLTLLARGYFALLLFVLL